MLGIVRRAERKKKAASPAVAAAVREEGEKGQRDSCFSHSRLWRDRCAGCLALANFVS